MASEMPPQEAVLSPISRLPPEILAEIFVRCIPASIRRLKPHIWINIPKVCSLWRSVALGCPEFWSTLILLHPASTPGFLDRAKVAPLVIRGDLRKLSNYSGIDEGFFAFLLDKLSQLGTLELRSSGDRLADFLYDLEATSSTAPRLQRLKLVTNDDFDDLWLPGNLFRRSDAETKAGLSSLHLDGCAFPWDSAWYSHITHLHLEHIGFELGLTVETLLGILASSPLLQTLSLIRACLTTPDDGFPVALPHLTALSIRSTDASCARVLKYLGIPSSATLNVACKLKTLLENEDTVTSLISDFCRASPTVYDTVRIIHKDGFAYILLDSARPWWYRRFRIDGKSCQPYHSLCAATRNLVTTLDFSEVTSLHLHGLQGVLSPSLKSSLFGPVVAGTMWLVLGHTLPSVRTLHLHKTVPAELFDSLLTEAMIFLGITHWNYYTGTCHGGRHAWRGLQRIAMHGLDLGETASRNWLEPLAATRSEVLRALLWARREGGARIWQLEIEDCQDVLSQDLGHFRLFADVTYDGKGSKTVETDAGHPSLRAYSIDVLARVVESHERRSSEFDTVSS
ncbi:hypothetical protein C8R45DRAFT_363878 [Mycena sanguinolenta]|nr:hypothetical protein C8R45DRAFT_363878 [Mycena sanguinolenta]